MKHATLALVASLALCGSAHAQAWPNAAPSPYGGPTAPVATPMPQSAPNGPADLGTPPHALGSRAPTQGTSTPTPAPISAAPPVADLDNPQGGRATIALNILEAQGYADFSDFRSVGGTFTALVHDGGSQFRVVINPDTGQISRQ
ncbi:MAG: hypothetical protein KGL11_11350 [Alphaproteobacteria bacterium]|nr:hypothetical protein [Alphaproteobacteria bacterium]